MRIMLDTSAYSQWRRMGLWDETIRLASMVFVPTIVLGELQAGFRMGKASIENQAKLSRFLGEQVVQVVGPGEATAEIYGDFFAHLYKQGTPLPTNDIWIGALSYEHKAVLLTMDRHFSRLPQVPLAPMGD